MNSLPDNFFVGIVKPGSRVAHVAFRFGYGSVEGLYVVRLIPVVVVQIGYEIVLRVHYGEVPGSPSCSAVVDREREELEPLVLGAYVLEIFLGVFAVVAFQACPFEIAESAGFGASVLDDVAVEAFECLFQK